MWILFRSAFNPLAILVRVIQNQPVSGRSQGRFVSLSCRRVDIVVITQSQISSFLTFRTSIAVSVLVSSETEKRKTIFCSHIHRNHWSLFPNVIHATSEVMNLLTNAIRDAQTGILHRFESDCFDIDEQPQTSSRPRSRRLV